MSGTRVVRVGENGQIVLPADVRERAGLRTGSALVVLETSGGIVLLTREQLRDRVRDELVDVDLLAGLLDDRRTAAVVEDGRTR